MPRARRPAQEPQGAPHATLFGGGNHVCHMNVTTPIAVKGSELQ